MKYVCIALLLLSAAAQAQLKIPGRKELEKKAEKAVEKATRGESGQAKSGQSESASGDSQVAIPPEETSSPAKSQINLFWKHIDKMRSHTKQDNMQVVYGSGIQNAQMALKNTKIKDAAYNTADMEKALQQCQDVYNGLASGKEDKRNADNAATKSVTELLTFPYIFKEAALNIGGDGVDDETLIKAKLAESDAKLMTYKDKIDAFLASNPSPATYVHSEGTVVNRSFPDGYLKQADIVYKTYRTKASVGAYQDLLICRTYIENAKRVYPNATTLDEHLRKVNEGLAKYGSRDDFMNKMAANQKEYVKNLRMGKPMMSNPTIEKVARSEYERMKMSSQGYTVTKVHIVSEWRLEKNVLDIPLHKEVYVNLAIKLADGKCGIAVGWVRQDYEGGGTYGAPRLILPSPVQELPCENLQ